MSDRRPNAKPAPGRTSRLVPVLVPVAVVVVAAAIAVLVATGGGSDAPPEPGSPEQVALGGEVFADSCETCHGPEARGGLAGPPLVDDIYRDLTDDRIRTAIAQGHPTDNWERYAGMPPVPGLDGTEVDAVIAYVREQQREVWGEAP